jgi:hypothetical protein
MMSFSSLVFTRASGTVSFPPFVITAKIGTPGYVAPLFVHVPVVIGARSKKQMGRVDTRRIVALVQNAHAGWYFSIVNYPRKPVRPPLHYLTIFAPAESPVPLCSA